MFFFLCILALFMASCNNKVDVSQQRKIAELEKQNALQQKHIATLSVLGYSMAKSLDHFDHSGIWNFFNSPEFWQNTYDVDPSTECYSKCARFYGLANSNCQKIADSVQRLACVEEAYRNLVSCTETCR